MPDRQLPIPRGLLTRVAGCALAIGLVLVAGCGSGLSGSGSGSGSGSAGAFGPLATEDLAGQPRTIPTTMGALEASDGIGAASVSVASRSESQTALRPVQVAWQPLGGDLSGYLVYVGEAADSANVLVSDLPIDSGQLDPIAPAVTYDAARDLGLSPGDTACFRIYGYDAAGALFNQSTLVCTAV